MSTTSSGPERFRRVPADPRVRDVGRSACAVDAYSRAASVLPAADGTGTCSSVTCGCSGSNGTRRRPAPWRLRQAARPELSGREPSCARRVHQAQGDRAAALEYYIALPTSPGLRGGHRALLRPCGCSRPAAAEAAATIYLKLSPADVSSYLRGGASVSRNRRYSRRLYSRAVNGYGGRSPPLDLTTALAIERLTRGWRARSRRNGLAARLLHIGVPARLVRSIRPRVVFAVGLSRAPRSPAKAGPAGDQCVDVLFSTRFRCTFRPRSSGGLHSVLISAGRTPS